MASLIARAVALLFATSVEGATFDAKKDFGAVGDNHTDDTDHILNAFDKMKEGGHTLYFPKGLYNVGRIQLFDAHHTTLQFEDGAEFTIRVDDSWSGLKEDNLTGWNLDKRYGGSWGWFHFERCNHLTIEGGVWRAGGHWWWDKVGNYHLWAERGWKKNPCPYTFTASNCQDLTINNVFINTAPALSMKIGSHSERVRMNNIKIITKYESSHNTDGILLGDVVDACVDNIYIENGDDCLKVLDEAKNITFSNTYCMGGHGLTIGGGGSNLEVDNVRWINAELHGMSNGARFKFTPDTHGYVKNIVYQNIKMMNVQHPIHIDSGYGGGTRTSEDFEIGKITFTDIWADYDSDDPLCYKGKCQDYQGHFFKCDEKAQCTDLHVNNVHINNKYAKWVCNYCGGTTDGSISPDGLGNFTKDRAGEFDGTDQCPVPAPGPSLRCSLEEQYSKTSCNEGDTFGCDAEHVWISGGCRGRFMCHGSSGVECNDKSGNYVECSCSGSPSPSPDDRRRRRRRRSSDDRHSSGFESQTDDAESSFGNDATLMV